MFYYSKSLYFLTYTLIKNGSNVVLLYTVLLATSCRMTDKITKAPLLSILTTYPDFIRWSLLHPPFPYLLCRDIFSIFMPNHDSSSKALCDIYKQTCLYSISLLATHQTPTWKASHDRLSTTTYSIYLKLTSIWEAYSPSSKQFAALSPGDRHPVISL